jgi:GNAT superfamily N-acetyltransferase
MVPIRSLGPSHRERIARHCSLDAEDRYLRFGYPASDEQIRRYVEQLDFDRDDIFGIYNRRRTHRHGAPGLCAPARACELRRVRCSVARCARGRGYGARLFDRAVMHARNAGVRMMFIHALSENTAMLQDRRNAGATVSAMAPNPRPICSCRPPIWTPHDRNGEQQHGARWTTNSSAGQAVLGLSGQRARHGG